MWKCISSDVLCRRNLATEEWLLCFWERGRVRKKITRVVAAWAWTSYSLGDIQPRVICYMIISLFSVIIWKGRWKGLVFSEYMYIQKGYSSFSLIGFCWCFQGKRNNLLLISALRSCLSELMFIFSQKLHWFSTLIFFHSCIIWTQKGVNDTWIVPQVLMYWKFSLQWLRICFRTCIRTARQKDYS